MLDPERLLWVPGRKLISIPRPVLRVDLRMLRFWNPNSASFINRMDLLFGFPPITSEELSEPVCVTLDEAREIVSRKFAGGHMEPYRRTMMRRIADMEANRRDLLVHLGDSSVAAGSYIHWWSDVDVTVENTPGPRDLLPGRLKTR